VNAILWVVSLAAHLGFDYLVGGHGTGGICFGNATILLYLAVTFAVQRMVVIVRSQRMSISGQPMYPLRGTPYRHENSGRYRP